MNYKLRWFFSIIAIAIITPTGLFLTTALARQRRTPSNKEQVNMAANRSSIYVSGGFTFSTPIELVKTPISPIFFQQDGEPEIKTDLFGTIYVTAINGVPGGTDLWKSTDKGTTFAYLGEPDGAQDHCSTLIQCAGLGGGDDSTDVSSGGYLYVSSLWIGNVTVSTSMDGGIGGAIAGQAWQVNPTAAAVISDDRQWIAAYGPQTLNMTYRQAPGTGDLFFVKSTDAGKTFGAPVLVRSGNSTEGNLVVDPYNGNLYTTTIPANATNQIHLLKSTDGGTTWTETTAYTAPAGSNPAHKFTILAVDRGANLHLVFSQSNADGSFHVYLTSSSNQGATWLPAVQVDSGTGNSTFGVMPWVAAGSPGIVDITWLGSTTSPNTFPSAWYVFFAQTSNALAPTPTFNQVQVLSKSIHDQDICFNGSGCANNPRQSPGNRDLLEYYTMTIDPDGNANIAFPDSLTPDCPADACQTNTWYTKQTTGSSAHTPPATPPPATFATNINVPGSSGRAEPNSWVDSHDCIFGGAIGGPVVFRSQDGGLSFTTKTVIVGTGAHGGDFDVITVPKADGSRPDQIYTADLGITSVHIGKSSNGGDTYASPGMNGIAGEVSASSDRMWLNWDRNSPNAGDQAVYLVDHEFTTETIRFSALNNDFAWSASTSGMTASELILPPTSTFPNTNPGPDFVDRNTHKVFSVFAASTVTTNTMAPPFGKMPNIWDAVGAGPAAQGLAPGPFTNFAVFKGLIDSPTQAPSPAPSIPPSALTYGNHTGNLFPGGDTDKAGNVYVVWVTNSARLNTVQGNGQPSTTFDVWFAASHDGGQNFYGPWRVSSGIGTCVQPWIGGADAGRVDIVYYQTNSVAPPLIADPTNPGALTGGPNNMPGNSTWNVMFAQSQNANSREPVFTVSQASDHIIHTGSISNGGLFGSSDRSLLDFFEVAIGPDGLGNVFCADNGTTGTHINYMKQNSGPLAVVSPSFVSCTGVPTPLSVVSRKTHGSAGTFDINLIQPLAGSPGIECRVGQGTNSNDHQVIFTFPAPVTFSSATVCSGTGSVSSTSGSGTNTITVNLTGVANAQTINICLLNASDGTNTGTVSAAMAVLLGDVNESRVVDSGDVFLVRQQTGQTTNSSNFRRDINASGLIDSGDVFLTRQRTGTALP